AFGLNYDPELIYTYVRDNIDIHPTFGLSKGALGAHLDKSGTSFDQAHLLSELLDEARINGASLSNIGYELGTLSLTGTEFETWFGISDAGDACRLLGNGGIPGSINGSTNCNALSGTVTSAQILHIWVTASINGSPKRLDAAYKPYVTTEPMRINGQTWREAMGSSCSNGTLRSQAAARQQGTQSGVTFASDFNYGALDTLLNNCSTQLWNWIEANKPEADIEDVIGGRTIKRHDKGVKSLPDNKYISSRSFNEIPDQYRTKVTIGLERFLPNFDDFVGHTDLFADEISGQRIFFNTSGIRHPSAGLGSPILTQYPEINCSYREKDIYYQVWLQVGPKRTDLGFRGVCNPILLSNTGRISIDMPYVANSGSYMDTVREDFFDMATRAVIVLKFGATSSEWSNYYTKNLGADRTHYPSFYVNNQRPSDVEPFNDPTIETLSALDEKMRHRLYSAYAEQASLLSDLVADATEQQVTTHYIDGWAFGATSMDRIQRQDGTSENLWKLRDDPHTLNIDSAISLSSDTVRSTPTRRTLANMLAALEASVMEQQQNSTAPGGAAQRFRWANGTSVREVNITRGSVTPESIGAIPPAGPHPFYHFLSNSNLGGLITADACAAPTAIQSCGQGALEEAITQYINNGYEVVSAGDRYLGPGLTHGRSSFIPTLEERGYTVYDSNPSRGGAFIAYKPDFSEIAHVTQRWDLSSKGGGVEARTADQISGRDIPTPADTLGQEMGSHSASLQSGILTQPALEQLATGTGEFPYALSLSRTMATGERGRGDPLWSHNWDMSLTLSGSGRHGLGTTRGIFASQSLALLASLEGLYTQPNSADDYIQQETIGALAAVWWTDSFSQNTASVQYGGQTAQFVRKPSTAELYPVGGGAAILRQTGDRYLDVPEDYIRDLRAPQAIGTLEWFQDNMSFVLENSGGDIIDFDFWRVRYLDPWQQISTTPNSTPNVPSKTGFRATSWSFPTGVNLSLTYDDSDAGSVCFAGGAGDACNDIYDGPRLTSVSNNLGHHLDFTWDRRTLTSVTTQDNRTLSFLEENTVDFTTTIVPHDSTHTVTLPDGRENIYVFQDAAFGQHLKLAEIIPAGYSMDAPYARFTYDTANKIRGFTNANGQTWTYGVGGGRIGTSTDPLGHTSISYYDENNNMIQSVSPRGIATWSVFDGLDRTVETRTGRIEHGPDAYESRTRWAYDRYSNNIEEAVYPRTVASTGPDAGGETVTPTAPPLITRRTFGFGRFPNVQLTETDPRGVVVMTNTYDGNTGLLRTTTGPSGEFAEHVYGTSPGAFGRPSRTVQTLADSGETLTTEYFFDDTLRNLTRVVVDPGGFNYTTSLAYDAAGNLTSVTDPRQNTTTAEYDALRRLKNIREPLIPGASARGGVDYTYNLRGELTELRTLAENGFATTSVAYTPTGRPETVTEPSGDVTQYTYDGRDQLLDTIDPDGITTRRIYYPDTELDRIVKGVGTPLEQTEARFWYDAAGNMTRLRPARGSIPGHATNAYDTLFESDVYGRPNHLTTFPDGTQTRTDFNADGTPARTYVRQDLAANAGAEEILGFAYDASARRVASWEQIGLSGARRNEMAYTYDRAGRIRSEQEVSEHYNATPGEALSVVYDRLSRVTSETQGGATVSYGYDASGNRTRVQWPDGKAADYAYDALGRLTAVTFEGQPLAAYTYDLRSRLEDGVMGNGTSAMFGYTADSELANLIYDVADEAGAPEYLAWTHGYTRAGRLAWTHLTDE
ncbi:MAG: hypothetical protein AAGJ50_02595, partial [Pseudomonadota bacterium]